jgi:hypothetical protein
MLEIGKMDREIIERLAMDSAAGELNEDIEALLQNYLSEHSESNEWFQQMLEVYTNTQGVFDAKTDFIKQPAEVKMPRKLNLIPVLRWSAVIIISVCTGGIAGRLSSQNVPSQKPNITATETKSAKKTGFNPANIGNDFWRNKITAMVNSSPAKIHIEKSSDSSLLETYKKYIKERNHE